LKIVHFTTLLAVLTGNHSFWEGDRHYASLVLFLLCLSAIVYYCYAIYAAGCFFSKPAKIDINFHPAISILKPICGSDSNTYNNLASFCQQDYPTYQIIFGVQDKHDPSLKIIKQLIADFPNVDIQYVINSGTTGTNRKVNNLASAAVKASYDILLLADSDVRVGQDYLRHVVQPLEQPKVGVVTCMYRSLATGWIATLEALSTTTDFHPGVLVSTQLENTAFAMGQTIVIRRSVLKKIGGFDAIADYLADDFQLGYLPAQAGYEVVLSTYVVDHVLASSTLMESLQRQIRWMLNIRVSRPWGYAGLIFTYGTVSSLLLLQTTERSTFAWAVLGITWTLRLIMAWFVGVKSLRDPVAKKWLWLVPLRDLINVALWCYGFVGNTIKWRGQQFRLTKEGELIACPSNVPIRVKSIAS
jgi:ceramide glucosyltransferase